MEYIWPIALIVFSNVVYQICAKSIPKDMNTMASTVQSVFLAAALVVVGAVLYHEAVTPSKVVGVILCIAGIYFINR